MEAVEEAMEQEEEVMTDLIDANGCLVRLHRANYMALLEGHNNGASKKMLVNMLDESNPASLRCNALCVFIDMVEHCGDEVAPAVADAFLPAMVASAADQSAGLRQAAVYGIGQCAAQAAGVFLGSASQCIEAILRIITADDARAEDNVCCTENAVSALGKIVELHGGAAGVEPGQLLPLWLQSLPLREDEECATTAHAQLCRLVETGNLLGDQHENVGQVVKVFAGVLAGDEEMEMSDAPTAEKIVSLLAQMQANVPGPIMEAAWGGLDERERTAMQAVG